MAIRDEPSLLQPLPHFAPGGPAVSVLRLDQLHGAASGNKWYKLQPHLEAARAIGAHKLLSFGGPYSNHLHALAATAHVAGMKSVGMVRGMQPELALTPTLEDCEAWGMQLVPISRSEYALREEKEFLPKLRYAFPGAYLIPEGGNDEKGRAGAGAIAALIPKDTTHVCCAIGTGCTLAGIRSALPAAVRILGFPAFRQSSYIIAEINRHLPPHLHQTWTLVPQSAGRGFGKTDPKLDVFMLRAVADYNLPLDRVYTAKLMHALLQLIEEQYFSPKDRIVAIHTGGLQGNRL